MTLPTPLLPAIVFVTGASVLALEVLAVRLLAPYFGNTVVTFSSVLSVVLLALALGYWLGGRLADRSPQVRLFFSLIAASGLATLVLFGLARSALPTWAPETSLLFGPLLMAAVLFFAPAFLLGLIGPFAIALQAARGERQGIGTVTGSIFFWSTAGSIAGSLLTGLVLIPEIGTMTTVLGVAGALLALGLLGLVWTGASPRSLGALLLLASGVLWLGLRVPSDARVIHREDTAYQEIAVVETEFAGRPARLFLQDRAPSGAVFLDTSDPGDLAFEYTKFHELSKTLEQPVMRALVIGGGIYSLPRAILHDFPQAHVDVVEIDPALRPLAEAYFGLQPDERLSHHEVDGRQFLEREESQYDLIYSDVYYSFSIPFHLATREFFALAKERLAPGGLLLANFVGRAVPEDPSLLFSAIRTFRSVFPESAFFMTDEAEPRAGQNIIFAGWYAGERPAAWILPFERQTDHAFWARLPRRELVVAEDDLAVYPLYTDDYAPVEYAMARLVERIGIRPNSINRSE